MWPFRKTKWVIIKTDIQPSRVEVFKSTGVIPERGTSFDAQRIALVYYKDELSGNEKVEKVFL